MILLGYILYTYDRDFFSNIDTEEKAYWLGFIAADGNISKTMKNMRINLNIRDKKHLEKFRQSIGGNQPIKENIREKNYSVYIDVNSKKICEDLQKYGITSNKSLTLDVVFNLIPQALIHHFIRGYFDGDGSINLYTRPPYFYEEWELSFISTEKMLLFFQKEFGIFHKLYTCGNNYRFGYRSKKDIEKVIHYMYKDATIYLDRKYEKVLRFLKPPETTKRHPKEG